MKYWRLLIYTSGLISWFIIVSSQDAVGKNVDEIPLARPLVLPEVELDGLCPVTVGQKGVVPNQRHIFGAGGYWFGKGPVYLGFSWKPSAVNEARFSLTRIPFEQNAYRAKTPWVSDPLYSGPIRVRGQELKSSHPARLRFAPGNDEDSFVLKLRAPGDSNKTLWPFWPTSIWIPKPGCYGLQIDTLIATDIVIFQTVE